MTNTGTILRNVGIARVLANQPKGWQKTAYALVMRKLGGKEVIGEDISNLLRANGLNPTHHNAFGGLIRGMAVQNILEETGRMVQCRNPKSHAHRSVVWRVKTLKQFVAEGGEL